MKWAKACFLVLLVGAARAQVPDARPPDLSARWAEYYAAVYWRTHFFRDGTLLKATLEGSREFGLSHRVTAAPLWCD